MVAAFVFSVGLISLVSGGAAVTGLVYLTNSETILDQIKDDALPLDNPEVHETHWGLMQGYLKKSSLVRNLELNILRTELNDSKNPKSKDSTGIHLKNWCSNAYSTIYSSMFFANKEELLLDAKTWCVLPLGRALKDINRKSIFEHDYKFHHNDLSYSSIKYDISISKQKINNFELIDSLKKDFDEDNKKLASLNSIEEDKKDKDKKSSADIEYTNAFRWCRNVYKRGFRGTSDNLYLLAEHFCSADLSSSYFDNLLLELENTSSASDSQAS